MPITDIEAYFSDWDGEAFMVAAQRGAEPDPLEVERFEEEIGFALPEEFRDFAVHPLGGLVMEVHEHLWPRAKVFATGPFWTFLYGLQVLSLSPEAPDWLRMREHWKELADEGHPDLVPFLRIAGDADPYCFRRSGGIVIWRHDEPDEPEEVSLSFSECVMEEIRELEDRKERKLNQRRDTSS